MTARIEEKPAPYGISPSTDPPAKWSVGRFLRACASIDESVMSSVRSDRHRYSGLGGIVLGTAVMAAASLGLGLTLIAGEFRPIFLLAPLIWGLFVFNLDRWLVASTHGLGARWALLPRFAIATLFGFVIAEPIVLWIFNGAIEQQIAEERAATIQAETEEINRCNPVILADFVSAGADPTCAPYQVNLAVPPTTDEASTLSARLSILDAEITDLSEKILEASDRYQREILGSTGQDTSGRAGIGPIAESIREELTGYEDRREALESERAEVDGRLSTLQGGERVSEGDFAEDVQAAKATKIAEVQQLQSGRPGLLQRFDALFDLGAEHRHIWLARWLLTAFLIAVDTMPVLAKAISNKSAYDRAYAHHQRVEERIQKHRIGTLESGLKRDLDLDTFQRSEERRVRRSHIEHWSDAEIGRLVGRPESRSEGHGPAVSFGPDAFDSTTEMRRPDDVANIGSPTLESIDLTTPSTRLETPSAASDHEQHRPQGGVVADETAWLDTLLRSEDDPALDRGSADGSERRMSGDMETDTSDGGIPGTDTGAVVADGGERTTVMTARPESATDDTWVEIFKREQTAGGDEE